MASIGGYFYYHLVSHIGQEYFCTLKSIFYIKKSVIGQIIILKKNMMILKESLMTAIPSLRHNQLQR